MLTKPLLSFIGLFFCAFTTQAQQIKTKVSDPINPASFQSETFKSTQDIRDSLKNYIEREKKEFNDDFEWILSRYTKASRAQGKRDAAKMVLKELKDNRNLDTVLNSLLIKTLLKADSGWVVDTILPLSPLHLDSIPNKIRRKYKNMKKAADKTLDTLITEGKTDTASYLMQLYTDKHGLYLNTIYSLERDIITGSETGVPQNSYAAINTASTEAEVNAVFNIPYSINRANSRLGRISAYNTPIKLTVNLKGGVSDNFTALIKNGNVVPQGKIELNGLIRLGKNYNKINYKKPEYWKKNALILASKIHTTAEKIDLKYDSIYTYLEGVVASLGTKKVEYTGLKQVDDLCNFLLKADASISKKVIEIDGKLFNGAMAAALIRRCVSGGYLLTAVEILQIQFLLKEMILAERKEYRDVAAKSFHHTIAIEDKVIKDHYLGLDVAFTGEQFYLFNPDDSLIRHTQKRFFGVAGGPKYVFSSSSSEKKFRNHYLSIGVKFGLFNNRQLLTTYEIGNAFIDTVGGQADTITTLTSKQQAYSIKEYQRFFFITPYIDWAAFFDKKRTVGFNIYTNVNISPLKFIREGAFSDFTRTAAWNIGGGIFFNLKNKDKTKPVVDFAVIVDLLDVTAGNGAGNPFENRVVFGIKTVLPFNTFTRMQ